LQGYAEQTQKINGVMVKGIAFVLTILFSVF